MGMYPSYKVADVLNEYAVTFFTLLNHGYRIQAMHYIMLAQITMLPNLENADRRKLLKQLEWAATDPSDILKPSESANDELEDRRLKEFFRGI